LEGYHSHFNDFLSGNNYSCELAGALLLLNNFWWNVDRGIDNGKQHDYGCYSLWTIASINSRARRLKLSPPHPSLPPMLKETQEAFGPYYAPPWAQVAAARQGQEDRAAEYAAVDATTPSGGLQCSGQLGQVVLVAVGVMLSGFIAMHHVTPCVSSPINVFKLQVMQKEQVMLLLPRLERELRGHHQSPTKHPSLGLHLQVGLHHTTGVDCTSMASLV
jgi:hypothetical protein